MSARSEICIINIALLIFASLMVWGCGKSTPKDACSLVTKADAESILGQPVVKDPESRGESCTYKSVEVGLNYAALTVTIQSHPSSSEAKRAFEMQNNMMSGIGQMFGQMTGEKQNEKRQALPGIGDEAYLSGDNISMNSGPVGISNSTLSVLKDKTTISMNIASISKKASVDALKSVAKRIANQF